MASLPVVTNGRQVAPEMAPRYKITLLYGAKPLCFVHLYLHPHTSTDWTYFLLFLPCYQNSSSLLHGFQQRVCCRCVEIRTMEFRWV